MKGVDECPHCGARGDRVFRLQIRGEPVHAMCRACFTMWEPFAKEDLIDQENALSIFRRPCDNCAWRKGSPERSDPDKWEHLQQQIHYCGATFYCHKGVPLSHEEGQTHDQPKLPNGKHNTKNMRLCAGYLAQRLRMAEGGLL